MTGTFSYFETGEFIGLASAPAVSPAGRARLFFNTATGQLEVSKAGGAYAAIGGAGSVALHDTTHSPVLLYQFQDNLLDSSGNGLTLSVTTGTARFTDVYPGVRGILIASTTTILAAAGSSVYRLTGDMTIEAILYLYEYFNAATRTLVSCQQAGDAEADNTLYNIAMIHPTAQNLQWFSESGAGVDATYQIADRNPLSLCHFAVTRVSNVIQFYLNGSTLGAASGTLATPTGGGNGVFRVGDNVNSAPFCAMASLKIIPSGLSAAQVLAEAQLTLGGAFSV